MSTLGGPPEARLCANCSYFDPLSEGGFCRLQPPQHRGEGWGWPKVRPTDFCGQHRLKAPRPKEGD